MTKEQFDRAKQIESEKLNLCQFRNALKQFDFKFKFMYIENGNEMGSFDYDTSSLSSDARDKLKNKLIETTDAMIKELDNEFDNL